MGQIARWALAALLFAPALVVAQPRPAADDSPRFDIRRFVFEGATLLSREQLEARTAAFIGPSKTFADVQRALEAVERAYSESGYSAVQIVLPEQELERGEIRFHVTEAKVGRVMVEGNKFFDDANIRASVPSLAQGRSPNIDQIARNLRVANENPAKQATVLLRSGQEEATVDAVVRVVDESASRRSITVDNTGTRQSGVLRVGLGYQHANVFGKDHVLTLQYVTAPYTDHLNGAGEPHELSIVPSRKVTILGVGYRIPLYARGDSIDLSWGWSNVNSGTVANLFSIAGVGGLFGARYTANLDKIGDYEHRLIFGFDYRAYNNKGVRPATGEPIQLVPDIVVHPLSATYSGVYRRQDSESGFSIGVAHNWAGGNDGRGIAFCTSRFNGEFCAKGNYTIWKWSFNHNQVLADDFQFRFAMNGQQTRDMLVSGEQFGIGGADSVRGFLEREVTNDVGYRGTVELYSPDFGSVTKLAGARMRALTFIDWGSVRRLRPAPGEAHGQAIGSAGFGLRFSRGTNLSFRVDFARVFNEGGNQGSGDERLHMSFSYVF
jgi:hemolysin activation/secretion protein